MKTMKITLVMLLFATIFISCCDDDGNNPPNNVCQETDSAVSQGLINTFTAASGYDDLPEYMDLETHQYTVKINEDGEICSIGYQNPSTYPGGDYLMTVTNVTAGLSYSGIHSFAQGATDYQAITPVLVNSGDIIKVQRTIQPGYGMLSATIGRISRKSDYTNVPFPVNAGTVEFLSSDFYGAGGPVPNFGIPHIALGFKLN